MEIRYLAFTLKSSSVLNMLKTDVCINSEIIDKNKGYIPHDWIGLWDTGASRSSIDKRVVTEMGLIPIGQGEISTANGILSVNTYLVDLTLPNKLTVQNVIVSAADLGNDIDLLIGMDIITLGDFSISNANSKTTFSFRIPSVVEVDFVEEHKKVTTIDEEL